MRMRHRAYLVFQILALLANMLHAQTTSFRYFYDDAGELASVLDSTGTLIQYTYDPSGNITQITRSTVLTSQLSILNVTPSKAVGGSTLTIVGQNFSTMAAGDLVMIGGGTGNRHFRQRNSAGCAGPYVNARGSGFRFCGWSHGHMGDPNHRSSSPQLSSTLNPDRRVCSRPPSRCTRNRPKPYWCDISLFRAPTQQSAATGGSGHLSSRVTTRQPRSRLSSAATRGVTLRWSERTRAARVPLPPRPYLRLFRQRWLTQR